MSWGRTVALLALLGATLGVALDAMHVLSGTTRYTSPTWSPTWVVAWWTFPLFASAAVALGLAPCAIERALGRAIPPVTGRQVGIALALFVVAYLTSCVVHGAIGALVIAAIGAGAWWIADRRPIGIVHALVAAIGGPAVEITLVRAGLFLHSGTELAGVPIWLPCLYLCASFGIAPLARRTLAARPPQSGAGQKPTSHAEGAGGLD